MKLGGIDMFLNEIHVTPGGKITSNGKQAGAIVNFTDNTGVLSPDAIIENVPPTATAPAALADAASRAEVNAAITAIENNIADLTKSLNEVLVAIRGTGIISK
jgi:hypothetical protein